MAETFDVNAYWLKRGPGYRKGPLPKEYHQVQEPFLLGILTEGGLPMKSILELGCGFGRVSKLLAENFPNAEITALDLSPEQLANAREHCAGLSNVTFHPYDFYSGKPFPSRERWDTVVAIEVFLHHPSSLLRELLQRVAAAAQFIVNIDWSEPWQWPTPEHVWVHDYAELYREVGLKCATFVLPEKVDGLQHRLFVAGRSLPDALVDLERSLASVEIKTNASSLPPVVDWMERLERAIAALHSTVPSGSTVILVNNDQWGCETKALPGLRVIPFLERDGKFWGAPSDDAEAVRELERLRAAGAGYLAVAWSAHWWLEHYRGFHEYLRLHSKCILSTTDLIVFRL